MRRFACLLLSALSIGAAGVANASLITYTASLSGANESPANASPGVGSATVRIDTVLNTMTLNITFSGLLGNTTASHIHCCTASPLTGTAGVATTTPNFAGFPLGVTAGSYATVLDLLASSSYNPAFITAQGGTVALAEQALLNGMAAGRTYLNIHTTTVPGGEIRGFLVAAALPEPASILLLLVGMTLLAARGRRAHVMTGK